MLRSSEAAPRSHPLQLLTWEAGDEMKVSLTKKKLKIPKIGIQCNGGATFNLCSFYVINTFGNVGVADTCSLCGHC